MKKTYLTEDQRTILSQMNVNIMLLIESELQQGDDEPDYSDDSVAEDGTQTETQSPEQSEPSAEEQDPNNQVPQEEYAPTPEEIYAYEIEGADDKFVQFSLYNKIIDLDNKIELLLINVQDGVGVKAKYFYDKLTQYKQYIEVLNELIFSMSTATIYKLVGSIELELIELLEDYTKSYADNLIYDQAREKLKEEK